jgi:flagellar motor switch protein FliN/FliY
MSDTPTDDVEELEAFEIEDDEDDVDELEDEPVTRGRQGGPSQGSGASSTTSPGGDGGGSMRSFEFLHNVEMEVTVELGRAKRTVRDLLEVQVGSVIELDRSAGSPVDILVNQMMIARGEVVVIDDEFAVRITEVFDSTGNKIEK